MISSPYSTDPVITTTIFSMLLGITVLIGFPAVVFMIIRRDIQPLRIRRMSVLVPSQIGLIMYNIVNSLSEIAHFQVSCVVQRFLEPCLLVLNINLYGVRVLYLWVNHERNAQRFVRVVTAVQLETQSITRTEQNASIMSRSSNFMRNFIFKTREYEWIWIAVSLLECIPVALEWVSTPAITFSADLNEPCPGGGALIVIFYSSLVIIYAFLFVFASRKISGKKDVLFVMEELKVVAYGTLVALISTMVLKLIPFNQEIFPVSDVVTSLTVILLMTISAVVPVYKTFDFKKIDFQPLEKDAVEEKRLTPEEELNLILSNEPQRESFVQHLMTEFSVENILFHDAVIVFRKRIEGLENKNEPNDEIWNEATNIWDSFLSDTSENEVNISHSNKTKIVESISKDRTLYAVPPDIFDAAFSEILHLMAFDSLLRYKKTRKS
eukprot:151974_1